MELWVESQSCGRETWRAEKGNWTSKELAETRQRKRDRGLQAGSVVSGVGGA